MFQRDIRILLTGGCLLLTLISNAHFVQGHDVEEHEEEDNGLDCCSQLFISAKGVLSDVQSALLGKYEFDGVDQRKNLIYKKKTDDGTFYLYYRINGEYEHGTNGWTIGHLDGNSYNIVTRNSNPVCPEGINGAYDRDIAYDASFNIACHSNKVKVDCCSKVKVSSSSIISKAQGAHLGEYSMKGNHNGYPVYTKKYRDVDSYLFYRKTGQSIDGWTISSKSPDSPLYSITTRSDTYCPNEISVGYNLDKEKDETFRISCSAKIPLDDDDEADNEEEERSPKEVHEDKDKKQKKRPRNGKQFNDFASSSNQLNLFTPFLLISALILQKNIF